MKINLLTFSLILIGAAAAAQAQTQTTLPASPGGIISVRDIGNFPPTPRPETGCNDFTNRIVLSTPEYYTNNQAAIAADQQYRIREEGPARGATALQRGPRIAPRPPTSFLVTDPWVELDHPWNFDNDLTESTSSPRAGGFDPQRNNVQVANSLAGDNVQDMPIYPTVPAGLR